jgi:hypothetical protein
MNQLKDTRYTVRYSYQIETVEAWSVQRLQFQPKDWQLEFLHDLRTDIHRLQNKPTQILHAIYGALPGGLCDIENILFYNVGMSHFTSLTSTGIRFERSYSYPNPPSDLGTHSLHFHRYTIEEINKGFYYWQSHRTLATWENVLIPRLTGKITVGNIWFHIQSATLELLLMPKQSLKQYGLTIIIKVPDSTRVQLANVVKPIIDGLVSSFHAYQGTEVDQISQCLGDELRQDPEVISHMLLQQNRAILGVRQMVQPYRNHIKWNPADDQCLAAELLVQPHPVKDWQISGKLFEIEYREPLT